MSARSRTTRSARLYTHDIRAAGVAFETTAARDGPATGCSYILVTPDGERTMNTYLGAAQDLTPARHRRGAGRSLPVRLSRGLSVGSEERQGRLREGGDDRARRRPQGGADAVGFVLRRSLSRRVSRPDAGGTVDLVFANEAELHSLYQTSDFDTALKQLRRTSTRKSSPRSEKGCVVATRTTA